MHRLIEIEWPTFGPPPAVLPASLEEFEARLEAARARMDERHLTHLVVYGDREHFANLAWLTNLDPRFEEALLILRREEKPLMLVGNECESYLPISPLWNAGKLRSERYQPFSLLDQPRDASRSLDEILRGERIGPESRVGCIGWKYYGDPRAIDVPSYIVDAIRALAGFDNTTNATDLFMHAAHGLRCECSAWEIAYFEQMNYRASEAMKRVHFAVRLGMTDHELTEEARYDGSPLCCHVTLKTGPNRISLASASGERIERGYPWSANIAYWGSNICRANWVADSAADLPERARGYVDAFAGPYFSALANWFGLLRIGQPGGALTEPFQDFGIFLNPGHLIHCDEWVSSPIYRGSTIPIRSGMVMQSDVIPSSPVYFSTRAEDGYAIADAALQDEIRSRFPECYQRCRARRDFMQHVLGIRLPEEVLPLSNMAGIVPPYLLRPNLVLAVK